MATQVQGNSTANISKAYSHKAQKGSEFFEEYAAANQGLSSLDKRVEQITNPWLSSIDSAPTIAKVAAYAFLGIPVLVAWIHDAIAAPSRLQAQSQIDLSDQEKAMISIIARDCIGQTHHRYNFMGPTLGLLGKQLALSRLKVTEEERPFGPQAMQIFFEGDTEHRTAEERDPRLQSVMEKLEREFKGQMEEVVVPALYGQILEAFNGDKVLALQFMDLLHQGAFSTQIEHAMMVFAQSTGLDKSNYIVMQEDGSPTLFTADLSKREIRAETMLTMRKIISDADVVVRMPLVVRIDFGNAAHISLRAEVLSDSPNKDEAIQALDQAVRKAEERKALRTRPVPYAYGGMYPGVL